jgi:hypothetical protein
MGLDIVRCAQRLVPPDGLRQLVDADHGPAPGEQLLQQRELRRGQVQLVAATEHEPCGRVKLDVRGTVQHTRRAAGLPLLQQRFRQRALPARPGTRPHLTERSRGHQQHRSVRRELRELHPSARNIEEHPVELTIA